MKAKEVLNILNIGHRTLGTYVKKKLLNPIKINTNHYEYDPEEVFAILGKKKNDIKLHILVFHYINKKMI